MSKVVELTKELQGAMYSTVYSFEIDTQDVVFGFKKTLKKQTKSLAKALQLECKLRHDVGRYLSASIQIVAVRLYNNGKLRGEFKA